MLQCSTYVRCSIDVEDPAHPRTFAMGKISEIDDFSEMATIAFFDNYGFREYYSMPEKHQMPVSQLYHCRIIKDAIVKYKGGKYRVIANELNDDDDLFYYHICSFENDKFFHVPETVLEASFNDAYVSPLYQMSTYEFQNPTWYFGRTVVNKAYQQIENSTYGFMNLAGCKIHLKTHQMITAVRCLSDENCRYMIADEVGMGKTIEAASVIKIYLVDNHDKKIVIIVPDTLLEQWRTELAFKFKIFEGENANRNIIKLVPISQISATMMTQWDFVIVDEVHRALGNPYLYSSVLSLSKKTKNIIMLSATPIQSRQEEFHKLLTLIQPSKYEKMDEESFARILSMQTTILKRINGLYNNLDEYITEIEESDNERTKDTNELFEEIIDSLSDIQKLTSSEKVKEMINKISYDNDDFGVGMIKTVIYFVCEGYQLEKCIIRNRRSFVVPSIDFKREAVPIPYDIESDCNSTEYRIYMQLSELSDSIDSDELFVEDMLHLIKAFFSSSAAFKEALKKHTEDRYDDLKMLADKWLSEDLKSIEKMDDILSNLYDEWSRLIGIIDYLDQNLSDEKTLVFTDNAATFDLYKKAFEKYFGSEFCCYFNASMNSDELELNTYRFQTDERYKIMLSDKSGGEGRNFQMADSILHIDIPWSANDLEQRIGRLARIGRDADKTVVSYVPYAEHTIEQDLFDFWNNGLGIFRKSQSGLEIIMPEIDRAILNAVSEDFRHGLQKIVPDIISRVLKLEETVKIERHFDLAQYKYGVVNENIKKSIEVYGNLETKLFASSMMSWSTLAGLKGNSVDEFTIRFSASAFQYKSANNSLLLPPDMKKIIDSKMNQMQNRIRKLNGNSAKEENNSYILGTFRRDRAMKSDYMHFFAPGDEIYDSIVKNAISSYKGRCAAIAINGPIAWEGFVYSWMFVPNEIPLLENGISPRRLEQYRSYVPNEMCINTTPIGEFDADEKQIINLLYNLSELRIDDIRNNVEHLGKRSNSKSFLGVPKEVPMANCEIFEGIYGRDKWRDMVKSCYKNARSRALEVFRSRLKLGKLKAALENQQSEMLAYSEFYNISGSDQYTDMSYSQIVQAYKKAHLVLDSICYVKVVV